MKKLIVCLAAVAVVAGTLIASREGAGQEGTASTEKHEFLLERGLQQINLETDRHLAETLELEIAGFGALQELSVSLRPAWAAAPPRVGLRRSLRRTPCGPASGRA